MSAHTTIFPSDNVIYQVLQLLAHSYLILKFSSQQGGSCFSGRLSALTSHPVPEQCRQEPPANLKNQIKFKRQLSVCQAISGSHFFAAGIIFSLYREPKQIHSIHSIPTALNFCFTDVIMESLIATVLMCKSLNHLLQCHRRLPCCRIQVLAKVRKQYYYKRTITYEFTVAFAHYIRKSTVTSTSQPH